MMPLIVADRAHLLHGAPVQPRPATVRRDDRRPHPAGGASAASSSAASIGGAVGIGVGVLSFLLIVGVGALELLVCAIQAYVFALLTSLYLNDAVNLH